MSESTKQNKNEILNDGKSSELLEAEIEVMTDESIDIDESDKALIRMDSETDEEADDIIAAEVGVLKKKEAVKRAKKKIDEAAPSNVLSSRPSGGITRAKGEIHSRHAYALMVGQRADPPIMGLYGAAKQLNIVMRDYRRGCLYASKFLIDTEAEINSIKKKFDMRLKENQRYLESITLMEVEMFTSSNPHPVEWVYFSPYAWHFSELLLQYDKQLRMFLPYYIMRHINRDEFKSRVVSLSRDLRRLFSMNNRYYFVGPQSFAKKDAVYLQARSDFGELSEDILSRKLAPQMIEIPSQFI